MHGGITIMTRNLTFRQREISELLSRGWTNKEVANKLGIGRRTVEDHRAAIYDKLGVRNAVELTRRILGAVNDAD